jgi:hypothetical protein
MIILDRGRESRENCVEDLCFASDPFEEGFYDMDRHVFHTKIIGGSQKHDPLRTLFYMMKEKDGGTETGLCGGGRKP